MEGFNGTAFPKDKKFVKKLDEIYPLIGKDELVELALSFKRELVKALSNQTSSLPAILNPVARVDPKAGRGIAVSIGGTNGYASLFEITQDGVIKFLNRQPFLLPQKTEKDELFDLITKNILVVGNGGKKSYPIGIGLAYPLQPVMHHGFVDGTLLHMAKGRKIKGLVGKQVGKEYHRFLIENYNIDTKVTVANDAICLLLGGNGTDIAGVVGTGLNFAYWEKRSSIAPMKLSALNEFIQREIAVNIESKNFNLAGETKLRKIVDSRSDDPGYSQAEKEAAGAYLYQIFNAGKEELLGRSFPDLFSTDELNYIISGALNYPLGVDKKLREKASLFADRILHRSAQIVSVELCGILLKLRQTKGVIPIVMEGGVFWKAENYPSLVNLYVNTILPEVTPSFARLFGSSRRGIAILAMS